MAGFHNNLLTLATYNNTKIEYWIYTFVTEVSHTVYNKVDIFVLAFQYLSHSVVPDRAAHHCRWFLSMPSCRPHNMQKRNIVNIVIFFTNSVIVLSNIFVKTKRYGDSNIVIKISIPCLPLQIIFCWKKYSRRRDNTEFQA